MSDRPILFQDPMVRAILDGKKTQTRPVLKPQPPVAPLASEHIEDHELRGWHCIPDGDGFAIVKRLPYAIGDRLWVRETWARVPRTAYRCSEGVEQTLRPDDDHDAAIYREGWERSKPDRWRPSIHMPRWASRITLTVTDVRVQRVQEISEEDAKAEGVTLPGPEGSGGSIVPEPHRFCFISLWDSINARRGHSWKANPWVCAITFDAQRGNIDALAKQD